MNPRRLCLTLCILLHLFPGMVAPVQCAEPEVEPVDPSRFEVTVLATGLTQPMEVEVAPDGTVYFIELNGVLKCRDPRSGEVSAVGELVITTEQENGLIGMALDPDFETTQWIYLQYSPPDYPGQHISRFTIVDGKLDPASERLLLKFEEQRRECCHHAGALHFGPNGDLYIATGDNTHPHADSQGYAPLDERPERAPWDAQKSSGNTESYSGKILRIRPTPDGGYEIPAANLFPPDGSGGRPEIYVMGCRNPWRMTVDSKTGYVYWGDVGPDAQNDGPRGPRGYDEINQARAAGNFGWPYFIADNQPYSDFDYETGTTGPFFDPAAPRNESPNNTGAKILPPAVPALLYYPYGTSDRFPELGTGGRSACAGPVYRFDRNSASPVRFPSAFDGTLFIYEWTRHWVKAVHLDEDQNIKSIEPFLPLWNFVRPVDITFGPEGAMYVLEYGETWGVNPDARLIRIDYVRGNRPPVAAASVENNIGRTPLTMKLSSHGSFDKDTDDTLTWEWRLINTADPSSPAVVLSREPESEVTISDDGIYNVELVVTDSHGARSTAALPVLAGNAIPSLQFMTPRSGDFFDDGELIHYELVVHDEEDGTNDDDSIDSDEADPLDPDAPGRVSVNVMYIPGPGPSGDPQDLSVDQGPMGIRRMKSSDCFNCHAVDQKRVGPPLLDIADKYRGQEHAVEASVQRVLKGSTGVWGKVPMIPHQQHTEDEIREMVSWIYSLEPAGLTRVIPGFVGDIPVLSEDLQSTGYYRLDGNYQDRGAGIVPPLTASASVYLRPRLVEAEAADEIHGPQILGSAVAGGGKFIGAINHGHFLRFRNIDQRHVSRLQLRIASAGAGGAIEIRRHEPNGPLLAVQEVEVNGAWEEFYDRVVELPESDERSDLVIRFTHPTQAGGLMNLDSVKFLR